jgi:hypothetical protein
MNNPTTMADHTTEMRLTYLAAVPHTLFTAIVWLCAGVLGDYVSPSSAIVFFIFGGTFIFAGGEFIRKLMKAPNLLSKENRLPQFFTLLAFTVPLSYPLIYLITKNNATHFFPAFMVLIGAHYLPFVYGYGLKTFGVLSVLLVALGTYFSIFSATAFSTPAYITAGLLVVLASIHYQRVKKEAS